MATRLRGKLGYADYARLPDDQRYEILDGALYVTPSPSPLHQRLSRRLERCLEDYFEPRGLGELFHSPIDLILGPHDIAVPDIVVVSSPAQVSARGLEGAALLVVEILSPPTRARDRGVKAQRYAALGVAHYWLADPRALTVECLRREGGAYHAVVKMSAPGVLRHPDWPGLALDLGALFA